jgi:SAM domain (Sterile alpha motif)
MTHAQGGGDGGIAEWLEKLGIAEYAEVFAENKINISALRYLTDQT